MPRKLLAIHIENEFEKYKLQVELYARQKFEDIVKPWLLVSGYWFTATSDMWFVSDRKKQPGEVGHILKDREIPENILHTLEESVPGFPRQCLANFMPSWHNDKEVK